MKKINNTVLTQSEEGMDDIVGILIAISVVSRRLAKKLRQLEKPQLKKEGEEKPR